MTNRTDNFNRADTTNNIGTPSDGGSAWQQIAGVWGILSNTGYWSSGASGPCVLESSVSAVEVQVTLVALADGQNGNIVARYIDTNNFIFVEITTGASGTLKLYKKVAGSFFQLGATFTGLVATGSVYKLRLDSSDLITVYQDGVSRISATDAAGASNTMHGMHGGNAQMQFDDFSITEIVPVGDSTFLLGQGCI